MASNIQRIFLRMFPFEGAFLVAGAFTGALVTGTFAGALVAGAFAGAFAGGIQTVLMF